MRKKTISVGLLLILEGSLLGAVWANEGDNIDVQYFEDKANFLLGKESEPQTQENLIPLKLELSEGQIKIAVGEADEKELIRGKLGDLDFYFYKGLEKYAYINGYLYILNGQVIDGDYVVDEKVLKDALYLEGTSGNYSFDIENTRLSFKENLVLSAEDIVNKLQNPNIPLQGAFITKQEGQLPGAPREYRHGHHEGFDWYAEAIGAEITKKTPVMPIYEGVIVRIDKNYIEMKTDYREQLLAEAATQNKTSQATLDKLRGRQIWVLSDNGVMVRYAHLSSVKENYNVGDRVTTLDQIATVGNSGTSNGALNTDLDLHLHSDILIFGKNYWEYGDIKELNEAVIEVFDASYQTTQEK